MSKQVKTAAVASLAMAANSTPQANNLYMSVDTFDVAGKTIGDRIVDLYHFGTRKWLQDHTWWAMHNGHTVEINPANNDQIDAYLAAGKLALAEKFNGKPLTAAQVTTEGVNGAPAAPAEPVVAAA